MKTFIEHQQELAREFICTHFHPQVKWEVVGVDVYNKLDTLIAQVITKDRQALHTSLVAAVEGLKEDGETPFGTQKLHETELAYNKALDDTLTIINSIFKE